MKPKIHCDLCGEDARKWAWPLLYFAGKNKRFGLDSNIWRRILHLTLEPVFLEGKWKQALRPGGPEREVPIMVKGRVYSEYLFFICPPCMVGQKCALCARVGMLNPFYEECRSEKCLGHRRKQAMILTRVYDESIDIRACTDPQHVLPYCRLDVPRFRCEKCNVNVCYDCSGYQHQCDVKQTQMPLVRTFTRAF